MNRIAVYSLMALVLVSACSCSSVGLLSQRPVFDPTVEIVTARPSVVKAKAVLQEEPIYVAASRPSQINDEAVFEASLIEEALADLAAMADRERQGLSPLEEWTPPRIETAQDNPEWAATSPPPAGLPPIDAEIAALIEEDDTSSDAEREPMPWMGSLPPELIRVHHTSEIIDPDLRLTSPIEGPFSATGEGVMGLDESTPSVCLQLQRKLLDFSVFKQEEVNAFAQRAQSERGESPSLAASFQSVADRVTNLQPNAATEFRHYLQEYLLVYPGVPGGISGDLERLYEFGVQLETYLASLEPANGGET